MTERTSNTKVLLVIGLILFPLVLVAYFSYFPVTDVDLLKVSRVAIVPTNIHGSGDHTGLAESVTESLASRLGALPDLEVVTTPPGTDFVTLGTEAGADVMVLTLITIDAGIVQLSIQIFDPKAQELVWSKPYQSAMDRFPEMVRVAVEAVARTLRP